MKEVYVIKAVRQNLKEPSLGKVFVAIVKENLKKHEMRR